MASLPLPPMTAMNTPAPKPSNSPDPSAHTRAVEAQVRAWLKLKAEVAELHARLEYLKLMLNLGVGRSRGPQTPGAPRG